ncbi:MAG: hypothetical protein H6969_03730 [Gammaproteobacteria bacterium]|nr:hypothetical protein [Gammaproteobacteria bacterium]MCP5459037.1 hypothetical protein [Gammaproteobacteria bacterium]
MKVHIPGKGSVTLTDADFMTEGGEGRIYARGDTTYKIYTQAAKMIPLAKIQELSVLDKPSIIRPQDVLLDSADRPVGFTMVRVRRALPLPRLFTSDFRRRQGIDAGSTLRLVQAMQEVIGFIHTQHCLIVDGNETNYLVPEQDFTQAYFIDVDSYQTPGFPATAIMPAIRDWHTWPFSMLSDWFSFAIIACQLFIGIHPYKGKHPGFKKYDLEGRMKAHVSIFNKEVVVPASARDFSHIPTAYRDWFVRLFEQGQREPPPSQAGGLRPLTPAPRMIGAADFTLTLLASFDEPIRSVKSYAGIRVVMTESVCHVGKTRYPMRALDMDVLFTPRSHTPCAVFVDQGRLCVVNLRSGQPLASAFLAERCWVVDNTLYTLQYDNFLEIRLSELGDRLLLAPGSAWKVLPQATVPLHNLLYQNMLGRAHLAIPMRAGACQIIAVPELDGSKIISGRWERGVAMLVVHTAGRYDRLTLRFNTEHTRYHARREENVDTASINFVTLDNGVCIDLSDDALQLFFADPANDTRKTILSPAVDSSLSLAKEGTQVLCYRGEQLYALSMKST